MNAFADFIPSQTSLDLKQRIAAIVANNTCVTTDQVISALGEVPTRGLQTQVGYVLKMFGWISKQETTGIRRRFYVKSKR